MWPFKSQHSKTQCKIDEATEVMTRKTDQMRKSEKQKDEALDALNDLLTETLKRSKASENNG